MNHEENLDHISPILPLDFFQSSVEVQEIEDLKAPLKRGHQLPDFSDFLFEDHFATISLGFHKKGLKFECKIDTPFQECFFPQVDKGDSVEVWIDTRDLKSSGFVTRFCHHFVFLPLPLEGHQGYEVTTFRGSESHELADPNLFKVETILGKKGYTLHFFLPSESLHGYDPGAFDRFGCAIKVNRYKGAPMHFALSSDYWDVAKEPSLWCSMLMRKK